ncbi:hypothetical protein J1605_009120 [Eschrichtius robustus]|uniref:Sortilin N-terminal domain-containing protein n=1 Tax=Eschrichtius robustus TaxID=9764 RepID=A0AB34GXP3_ESCRO|nr:hypothetical protein J1605_009120 [Eschrichtius robustus]
MKFLQELSAGQVSVLGRPYQSTTDEASNHRNLSSQFWRPEVRSQIILVSASLSDRDHSLFLSTDEGATFQKQVIPFSVETFIFHPRVEDKVLAYTREGKDLEALQENQAGEALWFQQDGWSDNTDFDANGPGVFASDLALGLSAGQSGHLHFPRRFQVFSRLEPMLTRKASAFHFHELHCLPRCEASGSTSVLKGGCVFVPFISGRVERSVVGSHGPPGLRALPEPLEQAVSGVDADPDVVHVEAQELGGELQLVPAHESRASTSLLSPVVRNFISAA